MGWWRNWPNEGLRPGFVVKGISPPPPVTPRPHLSSLTVEGLFTPYGKIRAALSASPQSEHRLQLPLRCRVPQQVAVTNRKEERGRVFACVQLTLLPLLEFLVYGSALPNSRTSTTKLWHLPKTAWKHGGGGFRGFLLELEQSASLARYRIRTLSLLLV